MKLALYQGPACGGATEEAFAVIRRSLAAAAAAGAHMLVMPELFLPGYNRPDLHGALAQTREGPWMRRLAEMAREAGCGLTLGWAEREGAAVYNAASCLDREGRLCGHYRKIQLFGPMEGASFVPGDAHAVFELEGIRTGLLICYDVEFAPHVRALAAQGVRLLLVPTANPEGFEHVSDLLVPARAAEADMTIAYANFCGTEGGLRFGGRSVIAGPDGRPLAAAGRGEVLLVADLAPAAEVAEALRSRQLQDFREPKER